MLSLFIEEDELLIRDVTKDQLLNIIEWFNSDKKDSYKYAIGISKPITIDDLYENYLETLINAQEFFSAININETFVGFIKGRIEYRGKGEIWIMSILVHKDYQNKKIGSRALGLLIKELKNKFGITDVYSCLVKDNVLGRIFWEKNNFKEYRLSKNYFTIDEKNYDLLIMHKENEGE
jgi:ribosomal protein S18 acetylase RimI-like enzyme